MRHHTDREILQCIWDMHRESFPRDDLDGGNVFIPIDIEAVAAKLGMNPHVLFGRLYYDLRLRHLHRDPKEPTRIISTLFEEAVGAQRHAVNLPYLSAILAGLHEQRRRDLWATGLAILALIVAVTSAAVQWATK